MTRFDPRELPAQVLEFLVERHLATLTTVRPDGSPHVVPVGFTFDRERSLARVITSGGSVKARNASRTSAVGALCQVDRARWLTLQGAIRVERSPAAVQDAEQRYATRYRTPKENPARVVLVMEVATVLGWAGLSR